MISEKLYEQIRKEGLKKDYKFGNCGGELDEEGNFLFVIRLLPTGNRLAKIREQKKAEEEINQHDGGGSFCMCDLCQEIRKKYLGIDIDKIERIINEQKLKEAEKELS